MYEAVCDSESNGGVCSEGTHRVEPWRCNVSRGEVGESDEPDEYDC